MKNIISLDVENVKRLKAVRITPNGKSLIIGGKNAQGKSSLLDAVEMALGGKSSLPSRPIRDGEDHARIVLELDDLIITRTFTQSSSYLSVTNKEGAKFTSGQKMLDQLVGKLALDPLEFTRLKPAEQAATLRELVGLDTFDLDTTRAARFVARTDTKRDMKAMESRLDGMTFYKDAPEEEVSVEGLIERLEEVNKSNQEVRAAQHNKDQALLKSKDIKRRIHELQEEFAHSENVRTECSEFLRDNEEVDAVDLHDQIAASGEINKRVRDNGRYEMLCEQIVEEGNKVEALTTELKEIDKKKAALLAAAEYPIDGIGIGDDGAMTYNGIPFSQSSSAEQLRVSAAMGLALNPKMGIILIRDGSLLDEESLKLLFDFAEENGAQLLIERVGDADDGAIIIEDGEVLESAEA